MWGAGDATCWAQARGWYDIGDVRRVMLVPCSPTYAQNPALRHELSFEMGQVHSDISLHFDDNQPVLLREPFLPELLLSKGRGL